jgi:hypothetical protein
MSMPGFTATKAICGNGSYNHCQMAVNSSSDTVIPALPNCRNCPTILERCENNNWRPRGLCNACLRCVLRD